MEQVVEANQSNPSRPSMIQALAVLGGQLVLHLSSLCIRRRTR